MPVYALITRFCFGVLASDLSLSIALYLGVWSSWLTILAVVEVWDLFMEVRYFIFVFGFPAYFFPVLSTVFICRVTHSCSSFAKAGLY